MSDIHFESSEVLAPRLVCGRGAKHRLIIVRTPDTQQLMAGCIDCTAGTYEPLHLGSAAWYDNHENLALLIGWQGDHDRARFLTSILEKPWKYEDEFRAAKACADHEAATGHTVNRDADGDCLWYCNDCPRRHGYDHECCKHADQSVREGVCCVCDALSPCTDELERVAVEDRDPEPVNA